MKRTNTPERIAAADKLCSAVCWMDNAPISFVFTIAMKAPYRQVNQTLFDWCVEFAEDKKNILDPKMKAAFVEFVDVYKKADCKDAC